MVDMQCPSPAFHAYRSSLGNAPFSFPSRSTTSVFGIVSASIRAMFCPREQIIAIYIVEDRLDVILWPTGDEDAQVSRDAECSTQALVESIEANRMVRRESLRTLSCLLSGWSMQCQSGFSRIVVSCQKEETCMQVSCLTIVRAIVDFPVPAMPFSQNMHSLSLTCIHSVLDSTCSHQCHTSVLQIDI